MSSFPPPLTYEDILASHQTTIDPLNQPVMSGGRVVRGTQGMTLGQVEDDILKGGKFVLFLWNFSVVILSFRRGSPLTYIRSDKWVGPQALMWSMPSFLVGWWGIPWGVIFTIMSLFQNCRGGKDVTAAAFTSLVGSARAQGILLRMPKRRADPVLWLLRLICLSIVGGVIWLFVVAISEHAPVHRR